MLFFNRIFVTTVKICEALIFIHKYGHQLHLNIAPESIVVNELGSWKLSGFEFACPNQPPSEVDGFNVPSWTSSVPQLCQQQLDFSAPEIILDVRLC